MLELTRKAEEAILIGDQIEITVVQIQQGKVFLGIEAPRSMRIVRKELPPKPREDRPPEDRDE